MYCRTCSGNYVYAYLHNDDAPEVANPEITKEDRLKPAASNVLSCLVNVDDQHSLSDEQNAGVKMPAKKAARRARNHTAVKKTTAADWSDKEFPHVVNAASDLGRWTALNGCGSVSASSSQMSSQSSAAAAAADSKKSSDSQCSSQTLPPTSADIGQEDFLLRPGSFTVLLCVDNQEFYAKYVSVL